MQVRAGQWVPTDADRLFLLFRSPARAMVSPGAATSLVNTALAWLQPSYVQQLTAQLQLSASKGAAEQLLPAVLSAFAAVLGFLDAHIQARQVCSPLLLYLPPIPTSACSVTSACSICCWTLAAQLAWTSSVPRDPHTT